MTRGQIHRLLWTSTRAPLWNCVAFVEAAIFDSVFYAPVKSYTNVFGSHVSDQPEATKFCQSYYVLLLEGRLPTSSYRHLKGARDLTSHLRLDYFLVERNGPFYDLVRATE